jgi:hypothetical protein
MQRDECEIPGALLKLFQRLETDIEGGHAVAYALERAHDSHTGLDADFAFGRRAAKQQGNVEHGRTSNGGKEQQQRGRECSIGSGVLSALGELLVSRSLPGEVSAKSGER